MPNSTVSDSNMNSNSNAIDKKWNEEILVSGGLSYFYPTKNDNVELKDKYRVAMTYKREHTKKLKYKIKTANGEIFSVAAKTQSEGQEIVNQLYGKRMYRVSQELV